MLFFCVWNGGVDASGVVALGKCAENQINFFFSFSSCVFPLSIFLAPVLASNSVRAGSTHT